MTKGDTEKKKEPKRPVGSRVVRLSDDQPPMDSRGHSVLTLLFPQYEEIMKRRKEE